MTTWRHRLPREGVRWVRPEKLHLTLCFLGAVSSEVRAKLESRLSEIGGRSPLRLELKSLGAFPNPRRPRVLWAGLDGDFLLLQQIAEAVNRACRPFIEKPEGRPFSPHLTLARFAQPTAIQNLIGENSEVSFGAWTAKSFALVRSGMGEPGSPYLVLREFPLGGI